MNCRIAEVISLTTEHFFFAFSFFRVEDEEAFISLEALLICWQGGWLSWRF
jgi:hypothetical protein